VRRGRRIKAAGFPRAKWLQDFDFDANSAVNPATIATLVSCAWVRAGQPLCLIGDSGTGKSHLLIGLGAAAAMDGHRVKYTLAAKLVNELVEAADEKVLAKTIARYGRVDLLCIDELGYMELDRRGAELLFQVLTEREETNSSRSPPTSRSPAGPRRSPTHDSAPRSSTVSLSAPTSSKPAPTPTASPTPEPNAPQPDLTQRGRKVRTSRCPGAPAPRRAPRTWGPAGGPRRARRTAAPEAR
jgi:hypothetical protein